MSERPLRYCEGGGFVVGPSGDLPVDACDYHRSGLAVMLGCNHLRCNACGAPVRVGPPGRGIDEDAVPRDLYAAENLATITIPKASVRLYTCRCDCFEARQVAQAMDRESDSPSSPHMPWSCAGHPTPSLPVALGDVTCGEATDWHVEVQRILDGACPRSLPGAGAHQGPSLWLGWLVTYLDGTVAAEALRAAIARRVADPSPDVRVRMWHVIARLPWPEGVEALASQVEILGPEAFMAYPLTERWAPLSAFEALAQAVAGSSSDAIRAVGQRALQQALLVPLPADATDTVPKVVAHHAAAFDDAMFFGWLADHAVSVARIRPERWRMVMERLAGWHAKPATGHLIVVAGMALLQAGVVAPAAFMEWLGTARKRHLWVDDAWVQPLESVLSAMVSE